MSLPTVVVLIGLRGAGKTTLGKALAETLHRPFADLDDLALARCPETTIREVFAARGEAAWRQAEADAFEDAVQRAGTIVALGGGAPMVDQLAEHLMAAQRDGKATTIWLDASDQVLGDRIGAHGDARPPLLHDDAGQPLDAQTESEALRAQRASRYGELAQHTIPTGRSIAETLQDLIAAVDSADA